MQAPEQYLNEDWWAEGDTPVREHIGHDALDGPGPRKRSPGRA